MINTITVLHFLFTIIATAFFIYQFASTKMLYHLVLIFWIPSTLLKYVSSDPTYLRNIGILEIVFFVLFILGLILEKIKRSKHLQKNDSNLAEANKLTQDDNGSEEL